MLWQKIIASTIPSKNISIDRIRHFLTTKTTEHPPIHTQVFSTPSKSLMHIASSLFLFIAVWPQIPLNAKWTQDGTTVAGGNGIGSQLNQFSNPFGLYVDDDQTLYIIADYLNHRIVEWKNGAMSGQVVAAGNGQGNRADQLNGPTDVIVDKRTDSLIICDRDNRRVVRWPRRGGKIGQTIIASVGCFGLTMDDEGFLYVSDTEKYEVRRWQVGETSGTVVAAGNREGDRLDQLISPRFVFVDRDHSVYVSDINNHRVMKWIKGAKEGVVVAGGRGQGNAASQLNYPLGMVVDRLGTVYVVEHYNNRIIRWLQGATQGTVVVGGNDQGDQTNQLKHPTGLTFDRHGNLHVVDAGNYRVQRFEVKVSSQS
jgi:sugar lactone lactonase YvrE